MLLLCNLTFYFLEIDYIVWSFKNTFFTWKATSVFYSWTNLNGKGFTEPNKLCLLEIISVLENHLVKCTRISCQEVIQVHFRKYGK